MNKMNRIKTLREQKELTQAQLAKELNVQNAAISKYEKGTVSLSDGILKKLSEIFHCSIDYIVCNDTFDTSDTPVSKLSTEEIQLVSEYRELDSLNQQILLRLITFLRSPQSKITVGIVPKSKNDNCFLSIGDGNKYVASGVR